MSAAQDANREADRDGDRADWDAAYGIMAHGLLTPLSVVKGLAEMLLRSEDRLGPDERRLYLTRIIENATLVSDMLTDMARGLPPEAWSVLDALDAESASRYLP